jgi:hypothetical protein
MRTVWKIVLSCLIWPVSVMAQDPSPPSQPNPPAQGSPSENNSAPGSNTTTDTSPPAPSAPVLPARPLKSFYFHPSNQPPIAPGHFTVLSLSTGYSVISLSTPATGRIALSGFDVSLAADGGKRIGAKLDLSYTVAPNVSNTGHRTDVFSYLVGPTISLWKGNSLSTHAHILLGGAKVAGPFPNAAGGFSTGHVHYPAWEFGGSAEYAISHAFGFRVTIDSAHTHFFNLSGAVQGQNDIRVTNSIVYYLGEPLRSKGRR